MNEPPESIFGSAPVGCPWRAHAPYQVSGREFGVTEALSISRHTLLFVLRYMDRVAEQKRGAHHFLVQRKGNYSTCLDNVEPRRTAAALTSR